MTPFGTKVRALRAARNISLKKMAEDLDAPRPISRRSNTATVAAPAPA